MNRACATLSRPVVIIGAARSGTNMLRDILSGFPDVGTWPCDEINYIWRHGNARFASDEFSPEMARDSVRRYIRRQFAWVERKYRAEIVLEKTCANSLRVPFVDAVVPEASYIFIRRNGLDVVGSALQRWNAPTDIPYLARKARFVPRTDLAYYAGRFLRERVCGFVSRDAPSALWGPRIDGMDELLKKHPKDEVCALQWQRCVESARSALEAMPEDRWLEVAYEDFVREPVAELARVTKFLGFAPSKATLSAATGSVRSASVGKGRAALGPEAARRIGDFISPTLQRYGYA